MSLTRYANTYIQRSPVTFGVAPNQSQIGTLVSEYTVKEYWDLRTTSQGGVNRRRGYKVSLRQRVSIINRTAYQFGSLNSLTDYWTNHYPVLVTQYVQPATSNAGISFYLESYAPKTLNTAVNSNAGSTASSSGENFIQHTAGSSTSSTHTWETNGSLSLQTISGGGGYSDSETTTHEHSKTHGHSTTLGSQADEGSSMTMKDWASLAIVDAYHQAPVWVWGQEYPWSVIQFHNQCPPADGGVLAPPYMLNRLVTTTTDKNGNNSSVLCPPSDIALTGIDFVAHATWIFLCDGDVGWSDEQASFIHSLNYWEGAHGPTQDTSEPAPGSVVAGGGDTHAPPLAFVALYHELIDATIGDPVSLNLPLLSLKPIVSAGAQNGAAVGFSQNELLFMGLVSESEFPLPSVGVRMTSTSDNLYVRGHGFATLEGRDSVLTAPNITPAMPVTFKIYFTLTDADIELSLYFKHWKTSDVGCIMSISVNSGPAFSTDPIVRHVDSKEAGAGSDNITSIILRKKDYRSTEFYDYLVLGLNCIVVRITPESPAQMCGYAVRALAIG